MYNKQYNTRHSGRYSNVSNNFVPGGEMQQQMPQQMPQQRPQQMPQQRPQQVPQQMPQQMPQQLPHQKHEEEVYPPTPRRSQPQNLQEIPIKSEDVEMAPTPPESDANLTSKNEDRPAWMKSKLPGVKKISNKERRRRQNETLRRLLTPKNALMVLNEMMPNDQVNNQFKVEIAPNQFYSKSQSFCADLTLEGNSYKGFGENKLSARNAAAEQAIRDLIIKKMNKFLAGVDAGNGSQAGDVQMGEGQAGEGPAGEGQSGEGQAGEGQAGEEGEEEALPMIQLASFALHKLFAEWEYEGHKVPQLRPLSGSQLSEPAAAVAAAAAAAASAAGGAGVEPRKPRGPPVKKPRTLPSNASVMHPCMLLTYMRPNVEYRELAIEGDKPQNMMFTMGVDVEGATYIGKAVNKREARKAAAKSACASLFGVTFAEGAAETTPLHK